MIIFKKIRYQNFLSVGSQPIEIDLDSHRTTVISGHNGSGKSLLLDAISFVLFGKPHRSINKPQLINSINGKNSLVEVWFNVGTKEYRVVRGLKPNIFEIWVGNELLNQESHNRDYQKILETNILKLNHKSFHQVIVLGSSNFIPFMKLPQGQRRTVIEDLLDIGIFSKMNIVLRENQSKLKEQLRYTESQIELYKDKITLQNTHIDRLKKISDDNVQKYDKEIEDLQNQIDDLISANEEKLKTYQENNPAIEKNIRKLSKTLESLNGLDVQLTNKMQTIKDTQLFYSENDECPTCAQSIEESCKHSHIEKCNSQLNELTEGYESLRSNIAETREKLKEYQSQAQALMSLNHEINSNLSLIRSFEKRVQECKNQKTQIANSSELEKAQTDLKQYRDHKNTLSDLKSNQIEERHYNDVIAEMLKDTGIKTKIIRQYLPVMNKLINNYLQVLDFFVSFELDENFNESLRSRYRDDFSYASFSEGEKSRIDLSLLFAWRQIAKMKNSANTNLLLFDEVFDGSLDGEGIDNLLKIMGTLDDSTRVFVITHKQDLLDGKFDRRLEFEKHKNFTRLKTDSD